MQQASLATTIPRFHLASCDSKHRNWIEKRYLWEGPIRANDTREDEEIWRHHYYHFMSETARYAFQIDSETLAYVL